MRIEVERFVEEELIDGLGFLELKRMELSTCKLSFAVVRRQNRGTE
jgi:hypothetical protein